MGSTETPEAEVMVERRDHQENKACPDKLASQDFKVHSDSKEKGEVQDPSEIPVTKAKSARRDTLEKKEAVVTKELLDPKGKQDLKDPPVQWEPWDDVGPTDPKDQSVTTVRMVCKEESESEEPKV